MGPMKSQVSLNGGREMAFGERLMFTLLMLNMEGSWETVMQEARKSKKTNSSQDPPERNAGLSTL